MLIGKQIQELRKAKKMSLTELAQKSGVQIATLSRIENLKMTGTLESHMAIAKALEVDITHIYRENTALPSPAVQPDTSKSRMETFAYNDKASYEILVSKVLSKKMMPVILKVEEGGRTNAEQNAAGAEKFVFILDGKITAFIGEQSFPLSKNNSLYFDATIEHHFENNGKGTAKIISVTTPVTL